MVQNIPLTSVGQLAWLCPLPAPCTPSAPLTGRAAWEAEMFLALCSTTQEQLKYCDVDNTVFLLKQEHSTIPDMTKKIISFPMKPEEEKMWEVALQVPVWEKKEGKKVLQTLKQRFYHLWRS